MYAIILVWWYGQWLLINLIHFAANDMCYNKAYRLRGERGIFYMFIWYQHNHEYSIICPFVQIVSVWNLSWIWSKMRVQHGNWILIHYTSLFISHLRGPNHGCLLTLYFSLLSLFAMYKDKKCVDERFSLPGEKACLPKLCRQEIILFIPLSTLSCITATVYQWSSDIPYTLIRQWQIPHTIFYYEFCNYNLWNYCQ